MNIRRETKKLILFIVVLTLLTINCFAAIISDNDGSAFVTKAEFDTIKNSFKSQIEEYNKSIDSKIDGAIASYLAGIYIKTEPINLYDKLVKMYTKPTWLQGGLPIGSSTNTSEINLTSTMHLTADEFSKVGLAIHSMGGGQDGWAYNSEVYVFNGASFIWNSTGSGRTNSIGSARLFGVAGGSVDFEQTATADANVNVWTYYAGAASGEHALKNYQINTYDVKRTGAGSGWLSQTQGGVTFLKFFSTSLFPRHDITSWYHVYKNWSSEKGGTGTYTPYIRNNGRAVTNSHTAVNITEVPGGKVTNGTKYLDNSTSTGDYYEVYHSVSKTLDGNSYTNCLFSDTSNPSIYYVDEGYEGELSSAYNTITVDDKYFNAVYYRKLGGSIQQNKYSGGTFNIKTYDFIMKNARLNFFDSYLASTIAGTPVKNVGGLPVVRILEDTQDITISFKILSSNTGDTASVEFSKNPFDLGVSKTEDSYGKMDAVKCDETEYSFSINDAIKGEVYMFIKNNTSTNSLEITDFVVK